MHLLLTSLLRSRYIIMVQDIDVVMWVQCVRRRPRDGREPFWRPQPSSWWSTLVLETKRKMPHLTDTSNQDELRQAIDLYRNNAGNSVARSPRLAMFSFVQVLDSCFPTLGTNSKSTQDINIRTSQMKEASIIR